MIVYELYSEQGSYGDKEIRQLGLFTSLDDLIKIAKNYNPKQVDYTVMYIFYKEHTLGNLYYIIDERGFHKPVYKERVLIRTISEYYDEHTDKETRTSEWVLSIPTH